MSGLRTYDSRRRAHNVSRHTLPDRPAPTKADLEATVHQMSFRSRVNGVVFEFPVLAYDKTEARQFGEIHLREIGEDPKEFQLAAAVPVKASYIWAEVLFSENPKIKHARQLAYEARQK
jgi:hypothetical protein